MVFDIAKAFDAVWHNGILYKIIQLGLPRWIIKISASFLADREFQVYVGGASSHRCSTPFGVPQGSVLSPSLYNIYVHDIPQSDKCKIALYADDTVIFASDRFIKKLVKSVCQTAKALIRYFTRWKISVNAEKTQLMFHSKRIKKQLPPNSITLNRVAIPRALSVNYLGVHLDNRLTFKQHIEKAALRADNLCRTFYPYIGRNSFATNKLKLKIYKTYIRPCLLYASPLISRVAKSNLEILQRKQNKFLRLILNKKYVH